jgi:ABC-2 type transport system ATP-binding protein
MTAEAPGDESVGTPRGLARNSIATLRDVHKSYGSFPALKGVSFDLEEGEIFGFIGPNGAGKTTTMKLLVGLLSDFTGSLEVGGQRMPEERGALYRMVGYMPQGIAFQDWRTVDHALTTFGRLSGMSRAALSDRIPGVLRQVGLEGTRDRKVAHLSGGMVQKLGLAQALLHEPALLVLDEPVAGLDPASRIQVKAILSSLRDRGASVIFSSHILSDVQDVAARIGIISGGRMLTVGTLDELKGRFSVNDDIQILLSRDAGNWQELRSVPGVSGLEQAGPRTLLLHLSPGADVDATSHEVLSRLLAAGNRVRSFHPLVPSLDELYLKYVGEGASP